MKRLFIPENNSVNSGFLFTFTDANHVAETLSVIRHIQEAAQFTPDRQDDTLDYTPRLKPGVLEACAVSVAMDGAETLVEAADAVPAIYMLSEDAEFQGIEDNITEKDYDLGLAPNYVICGRKGMEMVFINDDTEICVAAQPYDRLTTALSALGARMAEEKKAAPGA